MARCKTFFIYILLFLLMVGLAWQLQLQLIDNSDVFILLHFTQLFSQGGTYTHDFFETNPPMVFYVYYPAIFLAKHYTVSLISALRLCVLAFSVISAVLCLLFAKRLGLNQKEKFILGTWMLFVFLFLPISAFAQRDHIALVGVMPYLFVMALRYQTKRVDWVEALLVGLMGGISFNLRPHFLIVWLLLEVALMLKKRNIFSFVRVECLTVVGLGIVYCYAIFKYFPDYVTTVLPFLTMLYYSTLGKPFWDLVLQPMVGISFFAGCFYFLVEKPSALAQSLFLAMTGFLLAYFLGGTVWFYHFIPALGTSLLLMGVLLLQCAHGFPLLNRQAKVSISLVVGILLTALLSLLPVFAVESINVKKSRLPLLTYVREEMRSGKVLILSSLGDSFPAVFSQGLQPVSRFPFMWMSCGFIRLAHDSKNRDGHLAQLEAYFKRAVTEDLVEKNPEWVIVDTRESRPCYQKNFDHIAYFSENPAFKAAFKHYHFVGEVGRYQVYSRRQFLIPPLS